MDTIDEITTAARKILGPDADIPKEKNLFKDFAEEGRSRAAVNTAISKFLTTLIDYRKGASSLKDSCDAYKDDVDSSNFHLNPKDPKQKKQIADVQKSLMDVLDGYIERSDKRVKAGEIIYKEVVDVPKQINNLP
jgi:hypothetical protein